jgi:hypothetical protein
VQNDGSAHGSPYTEANARLIAAAPELLEALRAVQVSLEAELDQYDENNMPVHLASAYLRIERAIAKAEGRDE